MVSPLQLAYEPGRPQSQAEIYRALNAPLPKYVLGIGRRLAGFGPDSPPNDWNWSESWQENRAAGALPETRLLVGARTASTVLAWLAIFCVYFAAESLAGRLTGFAAALLYASNALVLLHGRRAMAEGTLLFTTSAALLAGLYAHRRPLVGGIASGLASATKQSALPLFALNLIGSSGLFQRERREQGLRLALVSAGFLAVTIALTPFLWKYPLAAVARVIEARQQLLAEQVLTTEAMAPATVLTGWTRRWAGLVGGLYIGPLQFEEVGNYQRQLEDSIDSYLQKPWNRIGRGPVGSGAMLGLTLLGAAAALRGWLQPSPNQRPRLALLGTGSLLMAGLIWLANPLPYQRYYTPLIPFIVLWQAIGVATLARAIRAVLDRAKPNANERPSNNSKV
ncbi:MAG: hypothetical protein WBR18_05315 [Anaerolineales bacterium]